MTITETINTTWTCENTYTVIGKDGDIDVPVRVVIDTESRDDKEIYACMLYVGNGLGRAKKITDTTNTRMYMKILMDINQKFTFDAFQTFIKNLEEHIL